MKHMKPCKNAKFSISYKLVTTDCLKDWSFAIRDLMYILDTNSIVEPVIEITDFHVKKELRGKGYGTASLKEFCEKRPDTLILVVSGVSCREYEAEPTDDEAKAILERLDRFYKRVGFIDVNSEIGGYQYKRSYIYGNEPGKQFLNLMEGGKI